MVFIILGPPGAGKGTQSRRLEHALNIKQISTGDMLRQAIAKKSPLGLKVQSILLAGDLVSDDIIIDLVKERMTHPEYKGGILLDGFPRTTIQAQALDRALNENGIAVDAVIEITVDDEDLVERLSGRRVHPASGRVYHLRYSPPQVPGLDDETGEPLIQRDDDKEEIIRERLKVYWEQTRPVVDYYQGQVKTRALPYVVVDGLKPMDEVTHLILQGLAPVTSKRAG